MARTELTARIEKLIGAQVTSCTPVAGGYTPATRLLCRTAAGGTFFAKAGATPLTAHFLRREIHVYNTIRGPFLPQLLAWEDHPAEPLLLIEDLSAHTWPPPWNEQRVDAVRAQIAAMHATTAFAAPLETYAEVHGTEHTGWRTVAEDPAPFLSLGMADGAWLEASLPLLVAAEARCSTEGESLTHGDLRSDNLCLSPRGAVFVDWNHACRSNPTLDLGFWLPSLAWEGGPPPEALLPDAPEVAAWVSGFFAARAGLPTIPDAPRVRLVQWQQLQTALPWAVRALGLPPLPGSGGGGVSAPQADG